MSREASTARDLRLQAPNPALAKIVEWRAGRIVDPVRRLGYLRESAAYWSRNPVRKKLADARVYRVSAFVAAALLLPMPMITDGAAPRRSIEHSRAADVIANIWTVESLPDHELYSNGLRIEKRYTAAPREAMPFQRWRLDNNARETNPAPFGIVYHTTESDAGAYEEDNNRQLRRVAEGTLGFVQAQRAYHFVIDRFGRVFRTVPENEPANHAGSSVWADGTHYFVNINHSFLGVAFEGQSRGSDGKPSVTEPQIASARLLTAVLRARYRIPGANCVTHAQVSVNPSNMGVGYHVDWSAGFPFERLGLPVNYLTPLPAITLFGFRFGDPYSSAASEELQDGISAGETVLRQEAVRRGLSTVAYRRFLEARFRQINDPHRTPILSETVARSSNP